MPYGVELSAEATSVFESLDVDAAIFVNKELNRLAEAPLAKGRPAHFPHLPKGRIYDFWYESYEDGEWYIVVLYDCNPASEVVEIFDLVIRKFND